MEWKVEKLRDGEVRIARSEVEGIDIVVHRHVYIPGSWLFSSRKLDIDSEILLSLNLEDAKKEATRKIWECLTRRIISYQDAVDSIGEIMSAW